MADEACHEGVPEFSKTVFFGKVTRMPGWFRQRLQHVLGPKCFEHYRRSGDWLDAAGVTKVYMPVLDRYVEKQTFGFEFLKPWVFGRGDVRAAVQDVLDRKLAEPRSIARHMRCDLVVQRLAYGGWGYARAVFVPWDYSEPAECVPDTMILNNCRCLTYNKKKAKLNGLPVPKCISEIKP